jgi:uncharacterized protein YqfA (UPF0365 family)
MNLSLLNLIAQGRSEFSDDFPLWKIAGLIVLGILLLVFLTVFLRFANLYVRSLFTGAGVGLFDMFAMSLRRVNPATIVNARVNLVQARITSVDKRDLEAHVLAGGNVDRVVRALIAADRAGIPLDFRVASSIDLAGRDLLEAVRTSVTPKVIDCPNPQSGKTEIAAVAKDGIQVLAKARVTVRTNISRLVGGAGEETIIARVGEGIVSTIGSKASHKEVLENPDHISKTVLARGLDAGTAFEIVSIDIADVDIGINIGARLQADQAEADKRQRGNIFMHDAPFYNFVTVVFESIAAVRRFKDNLGQCGIHKHGDIGFYAGFGRKRALAVAVNGYLKESV